MGENVPKIGKKFMKIVRVMCYMIQKGISKGKLLADLNIMMKRAKFAGKLESILHNLNFHHHHHADSDDHSSYTPNDDVLMAAAFEMINSSTAASPALPGFGQTPMVRQLRVTDSPYPLTDTSNEADNHVDKAAEDFIMKFYKDLKRQNANMA